MVAKVNLVMVPTEQEIADKLTLEHSNRKAEARKQFEELKAIKAVTLESINDKLDLILQALYS